MPRGGVQLRCTQSSSVHTEQFGLFCPHRARSGQGLWGRVLCRENTRP